MAPDIAIIAACVQKGHNLGSHGGSEMRLLIAMMKHETNTFSPVPTPLARFGGAASAVGRPANTSVYL
jgi:hypothetical protein